MSSVSGSAVAVTAGDPDSAAPPPYARDAEDVATALGSDLTMGLTGAESAARLTQYGPNQITAEKPPSTLAIALIQLRNPMNIMLIAVTAVSFVIGQVSTGVIVGLLIVLNVVLGTRQEGSGYPDQGADDPEPAGDAAHAGPLVVDVGEV